MPLPLRHRVPRSGCIAEGNISLHLSAMLPRFVSRPACDLFNIPIEVSRITLSLSGYVYNILVWEKHGSAGIGTLWIRISINTCNAKLLLQLLLFYYYCYCCFCWYYYHQYYYLNACKTTAMYDTVITMDVACNGTAQRPLWPLGDLDQLQKGQGKLPQFDVWRSKELWQTKRSESVVSSGTNRCYASAVKLFAVTDSVEKRGSHVLLAAFFSPHYMIQRPVTT